MAAADAALEPTGGSVPTTAPPAAALTLTSLNHFTRVVQDLDCACAFYCDVLGFSVTARPPFRVPGRWLHHPALGASLHLLVGTEPPRPWTAERPLDQRDHISFLVADIDAAARHLERHHVPYLKLHHADLDLTQLFCKDPDGNIIELGDCGVPRDAVACETSPLAWRTDVTLNDVHPAIRDTYLLDAAAADEDPRPTVEIAK